MRVGRMRVSAPRSCTPSQMMLRAMKGVLATSELRSHDAAYCLSPSAASSLNGNTDGDGWAVYLVGSGISFKGCQRGNDRVAQSGTYQDTSAPDKTKPASRPPCRRTLEVTMPVMAAPSPRAATNRRL